MVTTGSHMHHSRFTSAWFSLRTFQTIGLPHTIHAMKAVRDDAAFCGTASLSAVHFIRLCYGRGEGRVMMNRRLTLVPYGERIVPLPGIGTEPNYNTMCPNCDRVLPW